MFRFFLNAKRSLDSLPKLITNLVADELSFLPSHERFQPITKVLPPLSHLSRAHRLEARPIRKTFKVIECIFVEVAAFPHVLWRIF
jgi:hypothetical protein